MKINLRNIAALAALLLLLAAPQNSCAQSPDVFQLTPDTRRKPVKRKGQTKNQARKQAQQNREFANNIIAAAQECDSAEAARWLVGMGRRAEYHQLPPTVKTELCAILGRVQPVTQNVTICISPGVQSAVRLLGVDGRTILELRVDEIATPQQITSVSRVYLSEADKERLREIVESHAALTTGR